MAIDDSDAGGQEDPTTSSGTESADAGDAAVSGVDDATPPDGDPTDETADDRVAVGEYTWEDFSREYGDDSEDPDSLDKSSFLGFDPEETERTIGEVGTNGDTIGDVVEERTVRVDPDVDEDAFFTDEAGDPTLVNRYDLEKSVPERKKGHFREVDRYWVNKPYSYVVIFHSEKENEKKYYAIEPHLTPIESDLREFLSKKLKTAIKYASDNVTVEGGDETRAAVIERETHRLLDRYDLYDDEESGGFLDSIRGLFGSEEKEQNGRLSGIEARPEPAIIEEDSDQLNEYQIQKLLYLLKRDFIGYERIDPIKHDINIEDISCDGYNSPVFVYHSEFEQIISNIHHGETELDDFVVKLAQRSGKGISKRQPQVDATLPDGSRAQLTLGREVSDHGTNYTIRQFKDVPFTPVDLINWHTFSLDEMAFLWLCIENQKSLIFAGGTASGKTTSLNAVSLFIPSKSKIVSIEDTREVELPQRNWIASVTRPSFSDDDKGDVDEFDLLEAALRQRPEYIVMGEIRGEEGRTAFQVMSTGHTTLTTFHADSVGEVIKRFTTEPINVSKTMFTALDLVSIQTQTRVQGNKVRRNKTITEINHYDPENDEINVRDVYQWQAESDQFLKMGDSNTLEKIRFDRGWSYEESNREMQYRQIVLAYLIREGLNTYTQVAATLQAFINDPETILSLIATDELERSLEDLREMESVEIDIDPEKEEMVPRPDAGEAISEEADRILADNAELLAEYTEGEVPEIADALDENFAIEDSADPDGDVAPTQDEQGLLSEEDDDTESRFDIGGETSADGGLFDEDDR
ncbi:MAG: type II/IV secretion system ATPase subunit [Natronomonas sp.]